MPRLRKRVLVGSLVLPLLIGGFVVQEHSTRDGTRVFDQVLRLVSNRFVDTIDTGTLYEKAARGLVAQLNDPYSELFSPKEMQRFSTQSNGHYGGIGMSIQQQEDNVVVVHVFPHTPAEGAGVQPGDRIIAIDSASTHGWNSTRISDVLQGQIGTQVQVQFMRPGVSEPIEHRFTRAEIHVPAVPYAIMLKPKIAYIPLQEFNETAGEEVRSGVERLVKQGATGIILDLRGNPGGIVDQAIETAGLFLHNGQTVASLRPRQGDPKTFVADGSEHVNSLPLVVLVDGSSASAAEIVTGALQDHDRALVVGTTSFGKGLVQTVYPLEGGWALKLTTAMWYTPNGRSIQKAAKWHPSVTATEEPVPLTIPDEPTDSMEMDSVEVDSVKKHRPAYKSDAGRVVYGGGGITPDVIVSQDTMTTAEQEFARVLAPKFGVWNSVLSDYALKLKGTVQPHFTVKPEWRDELYRRLIKAGISIDRAQYDSATPMVDQLIGQRIASDAFGDSTARRRSIPDDAQLERAITLLQKGQSQQDLFTLAKIGEKK
ncbi:MAG TPA: S41 family peptidase [Gemmatimonadaceae bacterium]|nr:S41 family peptidase [Gemmatimonadaceae bacterium]